MFGLDAPELIIIAIVILVLFGSKKLPDAARALGRSMRIFKAETRGMKADEKAAAIEPAIEPATAPTVPTVPTATRPNPSADTPIGAPAVPAPPVAEPQPGSVPYEPQAGSEPR
jgi:sec-independent protein translocase protein TatA